MASLLVPGADAALATHCPVTHQPEVQPFTCIHSAPQFWRPGHGPEEVLEELAWAQDNDKEAQRIAVRGQELAAKYLTGTARTCYW